MLATEKALLRSTVLFVSAGILAEPLQTCQSLKARPCSWAGSDSTDSSNDELAKAGVSSKVLGDNAVMAAVRDRRRNLKAPDETFVHSSFGTSHLAMSEVFCIDQSVPRLACGRIRSEKYKAAEPAKSDRLCIVCFGLDDSDP